jgi:hypothetical protein
MLRSFSSLILVPAVFALRVPPLQTRRAAVIGATAAMFGGPFTALADEVADILYSSQRIDASVFVGTYTDPMHPGGTRTIKLLDTTLGPYRLSKIVGGGGEGEPVSFELPAMVSPVPGRKGEWQITIDFSPKGGPKDFTGYWDADGIKFPPTPRQIERGNTVRAVGLEPTHPSSGSTTCAPTSLLWSAPSEFWSLVWQSGNKWPKVS